MPRITSETKLKLIAEENALFLRHLRNGANATVAAGFTTRSRETFAGRRRADPDFADEWDAALTFARAALATKGRKPADGGGAVTAGGEYMVGPNLNGQLQVRRAKPGSVTKSGEEAFLQGLAATANIQLSAEAVGVDPRAFYKRRAQSSDFAQRMQEALAAGYEAVEFGLVSNALRTLTTGGTMPEGDDTGPIAQPALMTIDQALALLAQRNKTMAINGRHQMGAHERMPTRESALAALQQAISAAERRIEREKARAAEKAAPAALPAPRAGSGVR